MVVANTRPFCNWMGDHICQEEFKKIKQVDEQKLLFLSVEHGVLNFSGVVPMCAEDSFVGCPAHSHPSGERGQFG